MKKFKKITVLLIVFIMLASIVSACSKDAANEKVNTETEQDATAPEEGVNEDEAENDVLFKETFKFSYMGSIWGDHPQEGNPIFDELMKRTNTQIDFQWYPTANYADKVSVTLASGNIPDMIAGASIPTLINEGAIIPLDELLEKYGQNILNNLKDEDYFYLRQVVDGKIYHIPFILDFPPAYAMQIRKDWLENVGIDKVPETWEEWKAAWRSFKEKDANGDGDPTNEVPYAGDIYSLLPAFGINVANSIGFTLDAEGNYTLMYELPEFKLFLEEMRALYKEGLLDKEFATRGTFVNNTELEKVAQANLAGSMMTWAANTRTTTEVLREIDPKATLIGIKPIQGPEGKRGIPSRVRLSGGAAITVAAEDKAENIVKFFNYVFSEEGIRLMSYGIEGVHHDVVDGKPVLKAPYNESFTELRKAGLNFTPFPHVFTEDAYMQVLLAGKTYDEVTEPMKIFHDALYIGEEYFFTPIPVLNTKAYTEYQAQIFPKLEGLLAQCITGEISIDEFYSEYEKLKAVGLQDILDEGREAWKKLNEK